MTIIALDGSDCCYKTTTANKLSKLTGYPVIKGSSFELSQCSNSELNHFFTNLMALDNIIVDRTIYSNLVYASLYKDYSILNEKQVEDIEKTMKKKNVKTAFLYASPEAIKIRLGERGDDYIEENMIDPIVNKYLEVMQNAKAPITWYDTEEFGSDEIAADLAEYAK